MKTRQKTAEKSETKIQETLSEPTLKHWVYKLSIEQVALIFEAKDLSCFGVDKEREFAEFIKEYNELFNSSNDIKKLNTDKLLLRWYTKHLKLRAIYDVLTSFEGENSMAEFKKIFHKDFETIEDLKLITDEANRLNDKMTIMKAPESKKEGISFVRLVLIIEDSRGKPIDRKIKLYEFKHMYDIEIEKQNKAA